MTGRGWYSTRAEKGAKAMGRQDDRLAGPRATKRVRLGAGWMGKAFQGAVLALLALSSPAVPQGVAQDRALIQAASDRDNWRLHGRTYDNQRFSPLTGIKKDNVGKLTLLHTLHTGVANSFEATPLV